MINFYVRQEYKPEILEKCRLGDIVKILGLPTSTAYHILNGRFFKSKLLKKKLEAYFESVEGLEKPLGGFIRMTTRRRSPI